MKPEQIKALIHEQGASLVDVASVVGVSPTAVSAVVKGTSKSRRIAQTIALFLEKDIDQLWPGKYPEVYRRRGFTTPKLVAAFARLQAREQRPATVAAEV